MCKSALGKIADPLKLTTNPKTSGIADPLGLTKTKIGDPAGIFKAEHERQARLEAEKNKLPEDKQKPIVFLANPWLDGLGISGVNSRGRNSLRLDPGTAVQPRTYVTATPLPAIQAPNSARPTPTKQTQADPNEVVRRLLGTRFRGLGIRSR
jgi:hypothetical protein